MNSSTKTTPLLQMQTEVDGWIILHTPTTNSALWEGIIQVQSHFVHHNHNLAGKGNKASFWSAIWVGDSSIGKTGIASHPAAFIIYHVEGYGGAALWSPTFGCNLTDKETNQFVQLLNFT